MMKRKLSIFFLTAALTIAPVSYTKRVEAGIPIIDIPGLVQQLLDYSQQLQSYAEDLYQSTVVSNEYVQTLRKMEQTYLEYEHTLNQIKGLRDIVDSTEWRNILSAIEIDFPLNPLDSHWDDWDVDLYTDDGVIDVDERIGEVYNRIRDLEDVYADIESSFLSEDMRDMQREKARRLFLKSREITEQTYAADAFKVETKYLTDAFEQLQENRQDIATDDEAQLQTLQILAMQQELSARLSQQQNAIALKAFEMSNQDAADRKSRESFAFDMQLLDKLEVSNRVDYEPSENNNKTVNF
tara:strand:- start:1752 stop:2642 length:891 start_codon:yes stop_codon:yes gene_type:complete